MISPLQMILQFIYQCLAENLDWARYVLSLFCKISRARISQRKLVVIWAADHPNAGIRDKMKVSVAKCLAIEANLDRLMFSLKSKLTARSKCKLSLAGQILVANQVMLASLWYIATCWNPDPRMCHQLHEVVPNFIQESNLEKSRAKVWWDSLALLVSKELWGTAYPKAQAKSLLTKV